MVLGGHPPGRVGRRRILFAKAPTSVGAFCFFRVTLASWPLPDVSRPTLGPAARPVAVEERNARARRRERAAGAARRGRRAASGRHQGRLHGPWRPQRRRGAGGRRRVGTHPGTRRTRSPWRPGRRSTGAGSKSLGPGSRTAGGAARPGAPAGRRPARASEPALPSKWGKVARSGARVVRPAPDREDKEPEKRERGRPPAWEPEQWVREPAAGRPAGEEGGAARAPARAPAAAAGTSPRSIAQEVAGAVEPTMAPTRRAPPRPRRPRPSSVTTWPTPCGSSGR